jgi:hypothetical protein
MKVLAKLSLQRGHYGSSFSRHDSGKPCSPNAGGEEFTVNNPKGPFPYSSIENTGRWAGIASKATVVSSGMNIPATRRFENRGE